MCILRDFYVGQSIGPCQFREEDVSVIVRSITPEGEKRERVLWHCLLNVVNHGTHHRMLTGDGDSPETWILPSF